MIQIDASCYLLVIYVHVGPSKPALNLFSFPLYSYTRRESRFRAGFDDTNRWVMLFVSDFCSCWTIETCSEFIFFPCTHTLGEKVHSEQVSIIQINALCYLLVIFVHVGPLKPALNSFSFPVLVQQEERK